jgi:type I restriction enzyme S subunit
MVELFQFELGQVCARLSSGKGISAKEVHEIGEYPVYGGNGLRGYTDQSNFEGECAIIGRQGAFCGNVRYFSGAAYMTEHAVVLCANEKNDTRYLAYLLSIMNLGRLSGQSAQPGLSVKSLAKQIVSLPSLSEQKIVADTLSALDEKIENNSKINHHLEQIARAIFKSWFIEFEPIKPFTSIVQVLGGGTPQTNTAEYWNGTIPFFTPKDAIATYVLTTEKSLTESGLNNCNSRLYPVNTVFVTARGTVGKLAMAGAPMAMNQSCYALVGNAGYGQHFVYHLALETVESLKHKASGAVFDAIVTRDFESEIVPAPSVESVWVFEEKVAPIYKAILNNLKESARLADLRDALLPRLMSGELSVADVDAK